MTTCYIVHSESMYILIITCVSDCNITYMFHEGIFWPASFWQLHVNVGFLKPHLRQMLKAEVVEDICCHVEGTGGLV